CGWRPRDVGVACVGPIRVAKATAEDIARQSTGPLTLFAHHTYTGRQGMSLGEASVTELARRCAEETLRFVRGAPRDDTFCFELFARAVVARNDEAWAAIMAQYRGIILSYVSQHATANR